MTMTTIIKDFYCASILMFRGTLQKQSYPAKLKIESMEDHYEAKIHKGKPELRNGIQMPAICIHQCIHHF